MFGPGYYIIIGFREENINFLPYSFRIGRRNISHSDGSYLTHLGPESKQTFLKGNYKDFLNLLNKYDTLEG